MSDVIQEQTIKGLQQAQGSYSPQIQWSGTLGCQCRIVEADHTSIHGFTYAIDTGNCTTEWISPEIERLGESGCDVAPEGTRFYEFWKPINYKHIEFQDDEGEV